MKGKRSIGLLVMCILGSSLGRSSPAGNIRETEWGGPGPSADGPVLRQSGILRAAPPLQKAWLDFHEQELCLDLDVVFSAGITSLDIWCVVEKEKSYQKLVRLLQKVRASHEVYLYTTRPEKKEETPEDKDPPPSFWNNEELRTYLRDPFRRERRGPFGSDDLLARSDVLIKQRLRLYADSLLESELAAAGFGSGGSAKWKRRARRVCLSHLEQLDKHAQRLLNDLSRALPRRKKDGTQKKARSGALSPPEALIPIYAAAQSAAHRVYLFVYPENHAVAVTDLMRPSLLQSLRTLRDMIKEFEGRARGLP